MMNALSVIIRLSVLESVRRQIHLATLFLAAGLLVIPTLINAFALGSPDMVIKDVELSLISMYGLGLTLLLSAVSVPAEIERKTIYPLLARPMSRLTWLIGKFLSVAIQIWVSLLLLAGCVLLASAAFLLHVDYRIMMSIFAMLLSYSVLAAACIFFSTVASPVLVAVLGVFIYMVGGLSDAFIGFFLAPAGGTALTATFAKTCKAVLPHFDFFDIKDAIVHGDALPGAYVPSLTLYALGWIVLWLLLAAITFERKDL